jgi:molybdopterin-guanine dinucleotide biosynthesis protein A
MELNTALASNLFEYLEPSQMQAIFQRINTVYYDLVEKFKHTCHKLQNIDTCEDFKEVRQMCDICHEKI